MNMHYIPLHDPIAFPSRHCFKREKKHYLIDWKVSIRFKKCVVWESYLQVLRAGKQVRSSIAWPDSITSNDGVPGGPLAGESTYLVHDNIQSSPGFPPQPLPGHSFSFSLLLFLKKIVGEIQINFQS